MNPADFFPKIIRTKACCIGAKNGFLSFLQLLLAFLHGFHRNFSLQASNLDQQADFLKTVQDCGFLLWQKPRILVHNLQRDDQLSNIMQPYAHQKFVFMGCVEQQRLPGLLCLSIEIINKMTSVFHHMACMTCIVRGSFVNRGGHDAYERLEQFLDILNIKNILNGNGCLGGYGFHRRDDIGRKCADIPRCIHSVDELDHA